MKTSESILQTSSYLTKNIVEKSAIINIMEECSRTISIRFGRFLLKEANAIDNGNGLCYEFEGKEYNTNELFDIFYKLTEDKKPLTVIKKNKMKIIYLDNDSEESAGLHEIEVEKINEFEGADIYHLQVLKSAAGYYIGSLSKASWHPTFWEPELRDSACYWATRGEAENALRTGKYPVKF